MKKLLKNRFYILLITAFFILPIWLVSSYELVINHTKSLPFHFVIIKKNQIPSEVGQIFVFRVLNNPTYNNLEVKFIKILEGKEGDSIAVDEERNLLINDRIIGAVKTVSLKGKPLEALDSGIIPPHKFFAYAPHIDSYDSRYKEIGLIDEKNIIGTAIFTY